MQRERNKDGGWLGLLADRCPDGLKVMVWKHPPGDGSWAVLLDEWMNLVAAADLRAARLLDLDQDGFFDLELRGKCGASQICKGIIHRYDASTQKLRPLFKSSYRKLTVIDELLVESVREGCCAWAYHAFRIPRDGSPVDQKKMAIIIEVPTPAPNEPRLCTIRPDGPATALVSPPPERWLALCKAHGEPVTVEVSPRR